MYETGYALWMPVQIGNFFLVPAWGRVGVVAVVSLAWLVAMSYFKPIEEEQREEGGELGERKRKAQEEMRQLHSQEQPPPPVY